MASKRDKARALLRNAQQQAAMLQEKLQKTPPELIAQCQQQLKDVRDEVRRLQRKITS